ALLLQEGLLPPNTHEPPGISGGPPPPPPAPGISGGPLPPPGMLDFGMKPKKKWDSISRGLNFKKLHWNKIPAQKLTDKAFWVRVQEEVLANDEIVGGLKSKFAIREGTERIWGATKSFPGHRNLQALLATALKERDDFKAERDELKNLQALLATAEKKQEDYKAERDEFK
ncbi:unnamed protein product, partial [Cyprideis torosa]